jgi:hypothetical protein
MVAKVRGRLAVKYNNQVYVCAKSFPECRIYLGI